MKDQPIIFSAPMVRALLDGCKTMTRRLRYVKHGPGQRESQWCRARPGDRLWVRETWGTDPCYDHVKPRDLKSHWPIHTQISGGLVRGFHHWRSPIHMPRGASRLTLTVTAVRQERLQEITEADALAEGCRYQKCDHPDCQPLGHYAPRGAFYQVWRDLHGHESWAANPEVVVLTFTVAKRNIDAMAAA